MGHKLYIDMWLSLICNGCVESNGDFCETISTSKVEYEPGGGGDTWVKFCWVCALASQNPYPIIVYFWSILWPIINPILVTFGQMIFLLSKSRKRATPF